MNTRSTDMSRQEHEFPPVFDENSEILILGSFPSVKSREAHFYYGHPQNRFWKVLSTIYDCPMPASTEEKTAFLLENRLALWDVIESCTICGSSDSSIRDVVPNKIEWILKQAPIRKIYANGSLAAQLYKKHIYLKTGIPAERLPSTSPANAAWSVEKLIEAWSCIRNQEYGQV